MLTALERLRSQTRYPLSTLVVLAHAKAGVRSGSANEPREAPMQPPIWTNTSAETRVRPARIVPPRRSNAYTSHQAPIEIP